MFMYLINITLSDHIKVVIDSQDIKQNVHRPWESPMYFDMDLSCIIPLINPYESKPPIKAKMYVYSIYSRTLRAYAGKR